MYKARSKAQWTRGREHGRLLATEAEAVGKVAWRSVWAPCGLTWMPRGRVAVGTWWVNGYGSRTVGACWLNGRVWLPGGRIDGRGCLVGERMWMPGKQVCTGSEWVYGQTLTS